MTRELFSDVQLDHPWAEKYRLPVMNSWFPQFYYLLTVAVAPPADASWGKLDDIETPTEEEAAMLGSYLEYKKSADFHDAAYVERVFHSKALDINPGGPSMSFVKRNKYRWGYVRSTWREQNPVPGYGYTHLIDDLEELLDMIEYHVIGKPSDRWGAWKAAHLNIFKTSAPLSKGHENVK